MNFFIPARRRSRLGSPATALEPASSPEKMKIRRALHVPTQNVEQ